MHAGQKWRKNAILISSDIYFTYSSSRVHGWTESDGDTQQYSYWLSQTNLRKTSPNLINEVINENEHKENSFHGSYYDVCQKDILKVVF